MRIAAIPFEIVGQIALVFFFPWTFGGPILAVICLLTGPGRSVGVGKVEGALAVLLLWGFSMLILLLLLAPMWFDLFGKLKFALVDHYSRIYMRRLG